MDKRIFRRRVLAACIAGALVVLTSCRQAPATGSAEGDAAAALAGNVSPGTGQIYLYGEAHGNQAIYEKEFALWRDAYQKDGLRHLFVELPCYTAEYLNRWMQVPDDAILEALYDEWEGTQAHVPAIKTFYRDIKEQCPETVFHGTDVGHQAGTTGARYLQEMKENGQQNSPQYAQAQAVIAQGNHYYRAQDDAYRENKMVENFTAAFDALETENVMGFYGSAHTSLNAMNYTGKVACMATQLAARYGDAVHSEDLSWMASEAVEPLRTDVLEIGGTEYQASYFGEADLTAFSKEYVTRRYWRLEDAGEDFAACRQTGEVLPYHNFPMRIESGQVFVIDYTRTDGSVERRYYRADAGDTWQGQATTRGIEIPKG